MRKKDKKRAYSVMTSHPVYLRLRRKYGLDSKKRKETNLWLTMTMKMMSLSKNGSVGIICLGWGYMLLF